MSEKKPMVLVLAGPNGSGKSTIVYGARVSRMILDQVLACEGKLWLD